MKKQVLVSFTIRLTAILLGWALTASCFIGVFYMFSPMKDGHYHWHDSVISGSGFSALVLLFSQLSAQKRQASASKLQPKS